MLPIAFGIAAAYTAPATLPARAASVCMSAQVVNAPASATESERLSNEVAAFQAKTAPLLAQLRFDAARDSLARELAAREEAATLASTKSELLALSRSLERGAVEDADGHARVAELVARLERCNAVTRPLDSPLLSGRWQLAYTTSRSILGLDRRSKPVGPILQTLDVPTLTARNDETLRWGSRRFRRLGIRMKRFVEAELQPMSASKVAVQFKRFGVGPLRIPAPAKARGELDTTYLDDTLRISRGDKGNLFVLFRVSADSSRSA